MVNQNSNSRRRNNRHRHRRTSSSSYSAKATNSQAQVRAANCQSPSPSRSLSPSSYSSSSSSSSNIDDCLHPSCIKHRFPSGRTTHVNRCCYRFTNPRRFEGILLKRGVYDRETHRSSGDSSSLDMTTTGAGHAQQCGTDHHARDNLHPCTRAQQPQIAVNYNNGHPKDDELKIKDTLYLFNKNNNGQKNLWGLVPEEEQDKEVSEGVRVKTSIASKSKKSRVRRQRTARALRAHRIQEVHLSQEVRRVHEVSHPKRPPQPIITDVPERECMIDAQEDDVFHPCSLAPPQTLFSGSYCGPKPGTKDSTLVVRIKGIEFTALASSDTDVARGLGLCYNDLYDEKTMNDRRLPVRRTTIGVIPTYVPFSKRGMFRIWTLLDVEDLGYYDLHIGMDILYGCGVYSFCQSRPSCLSSAVQDGTPLFYRTDGRQRHQHGALNLFFL